MGRQQVATIARFTLLEASRARLLWLFVIALVLIFGFAYFLQQLAITDSLRIHTAFAAAASRLAAVFVLSLYIVSSIVREFNDKGLELTLSFELRRSDYIIGRLLGYITIGVAVALLAGLPQLLSSSLNASLQWAISLAFELMIVATLSLFCILTFNQLIPAASFIAGFYLLARAMTAIRLISADPLVDDGELLHRFMSWLVEALSLVLPSLDRFTQSAWLVDQAAGWSAIGACAVQTLIYTLLLMSASMFDFYRKNL